MSGFGGRVAEHCMARLCSSIALLSVLYELERLKGVKRAVALCMQQQIFHNSAVWEAGSRAGEFMKCARWTLHRGATLLNIKEFSPYKSVC